MQEKKISNITSEEAVFSSQYRRKLYIKHFLLTKRGAGVLLFMALLEYFDMLHVYTAIFFLIVIVALYLRNTDLSHERDKTVWLLGIRKKFFDMLEAEKIENELFVVNMSIDEYKLSTFYNHKIKRERKLLLHKKELQKFQRKLKDVGMTIVPLKLYINDRGKAKMLIALGRGKKLFDKRETIKNRENKRNLDRILKKT